MDRQIIQWLLPVSLTTLWEPRGRMVVHHQHLEQEALLCVTGDW